LAIADPDMVKEALMGTDESFERIELDPLTKQFLGQGLAGVRGEKWALHRRIANQAFKLERVKVMSPKLNRQPPLFLKKKKN
jgi:cytochrome P450